MIKFINKSFKNLKRYLLPVVNSFSKLFNYCFHYSERKLFAEPKSIINMKAAGTSYCAKNPPLSTLALEPSHNNGLTVFTRVLSSSRPTQ